MRIDAEAYARLPAHLQALFVVAPNPGRDEVVGAFPEVKTTRATVTSTPGKIYGGGARLPSHTGTYGADEVGSAARFFYTAKADANDRSGALHPTVKPLDLIQYLCRLICPPNGTVLDPFAGTGTTGEAAWREGFRAILIEREAEYQQDIARRMEWALMGEQSRKIEQARIDAERGRLRNKPFEVDLFATEGTGNE